jgi:uncharacterized RDD family membrane protein YckC
MTEGQGGRPPGRVDPIAAIEWPSAPRVVRYPKASFFGRVLAHFVDSLIGGFPFVLAAIALMVGLTTGTGAPVFMVLLGVAIVWMLYYLFAKDGRNGGQSIGKKMFNLRVINVTTNEPCSTSESIVRQLDLFFLQLIPIVGWLVEPIVALASEDGRRLGDRAAGTQVIEARDYRPNEPNE